MKSLIPAKTNSQRVPDKNWRPFFGNYSLVDILVQKLISCGSCVSDIYISCEDEDKLDEMHSRYGTSSVIRDRDLCDNSVSLTEWISRICSQIPDNDDIAWCQTCSPLWNEYSQCFHKWESVREDYDSLVVCHPFKGYLMTENHQPVGWSFGKHHTPSQFLPKFTTMPFTLSIFSRESAVNTSYHVGSKPFWHESSGFNVDIDTMDDFQAASRLFGFTEFAAKLRNTASIDSNQTPML